MCTRLLTLGCPEEKVHYLPYGVDATFFTPAEDAGAYFLSCGRFVEKKGPLLTLEAFSRVRSNFPEARLRMIGDGPLLEAARNLADEMGLNAHVDFLGVLPPDRVAKEMRNAFCFLQHSKTTSDHDSEGTPLAILEASATGLPIVATRHAGIVDVVEDKRSGLLVKEGDVVEMANCMETLLNDPLKAKQLGVRGREIILEKFQQSHYLAALSQLIERCYLNR
ncbi:MAG: hypothetical protein A3D92_14625 [Bacteroidetes bacterium RIFCSPHIGHO2_02_FULL_44_7]|nr:MAG: hypothetical protein A3D92_14625 [Bacteroidetes bacterium RIFCSPHIGHO2_02_FULL_44_7]